MASFGAIIAAAGSGTRLGAGRPKALVELAGEPLIVHAVRGLWRAGITDIIVTIPPAAEAEFARVLEGAPARVRFAPGGVSRQGSVANGLKLLDSEFVLIHDAARALTPVDVIRRVMGALEQGYDAVIPALPVTDTIKVAGMALAGEVGGGAYDGAPRRETGASAPGEQIGPGNAGAAAFGTGADGPGLQIGPGSAGVAGLETVQRTLKRANLRAVQTPQGFKTQTIRRAHEAGAKLSASEAAAAPDDAALVELMGGEVALVEGSYRAMKVTTAWDLQVAELLLEQIERERAERGAASDNSGGHA